MDRAPASPATSRDQRLWEQEVETIRAQRDTMTPAIAVALQSVLQSIAGEQVPDERFARAARELLVEMSESPTPVRTQQTGALRLRAA